LPFSAAISKIQLKKLPIELPHPEDQWILSVFQPVMFAGLPEISRFRTCNEIRLCYIASSAVSDRQAGS
jgi:hypothetical protein